MINSLISASSLVTDSALRHHRWKWLAAAISACALMAPATTLAIIARTAWQIL